MFLKCWSEAAYQVELARRLSTSVWRIAGTKCFFPLLFSCLFLPLVQIGATADRRNCCLLIESMSQRGSRSHRSIDGVDTSLATWRIPVFIVRVWNIEVCIVIREKIAKIHFLLARHSSIALFTWLHAKSARVRSTRCTTPCSHQRVSQYIIDYFSQGCATCAILSHSLYYITLGNRDRTLHCTSYSIEVKYTTTLDND